MHAVVILILLQLFGARISGQINEDSKHQQHRLRELNLEFHRWSMEAEENLVPVLLKISKNRDTCKGTIHGLNAILQKLSLEFQNVAISYSEQMSPSKTLVILEDLRSRSSSLVTESSNEEPDACLDAHKLESSRFMERLTSFEDRIKNVPRGNPIESFIRDLGMRNMTNIMRTLQTQGNLTSFLEEFMDQISSVSSHFDANFDIMLWLLETASSERPILEPFSIILLERLKRFDLLLTYKTLQLARVVRNINGTATLQQRFPKQIQNLVWNKVNCIKNVGKGYLLREKGFPRSLVYTSNLALGLVEMNSVTSLSCGWVFQNLNSAWNQFKISRYSQDGTNIRSLRHFSRYALYLALSGQEGVSWEVVPSKVIDPGSKVEDIVFEIRSKNHTLCQLQSVSRIQGVAEVLLRNLTRTAGNDCKWTLVNTQ